jgi:GTP cyclohydrolase I
MVKREDEQAFAELNAAEPDLRGGRCARLICGSAPRKIKAGSAISGWWRATRRALHSHDAVSILTDGDTFAQVSFDPRTFASLYHVG